MENKKSKRFSRSQLKDKEKLQINNLSTKLKCMPLSDLEKFPLYRSGDGIKQYNHGDLIRYKNGSILYIMENQETKEKVPTLITVVKDLKIVNSEKINNTSKKKLKKVSKKKVKINNKPTIIDSEDAILKFNEYFNKIKNKNNLIETNYNFIGNEWFIEKIIPLKKIKNKLENNNDYDSELDFDEEELN
jgi:hypothetical protein